MRPFLLCLLLLLAQPVLAKQKIIIDTDPGVDDLMAISLAIQSPDIEVVGITSIFGNVPTKQATINALTLVEYFGQQIPVYEGAYLPMNGKQQPPSVDVHGQDGLGDLFLPLPTLKQETMPAAHFIVETINRNPNQIILLVLGPQTNLAEALRIDPSIAKKVKEVVIMGGAFETAGNITEHSEWNIWQDPVAAQKVAQASWPKTYIGLDATTQVVLTDQHLFEIADLSPMLGNLLVDVSRKYFDFYRQTYGMDRSGFMHDPSALLYITHPQAFGFKQGKVNVATDAEHWGKTSLNQKKSNTKVAYQVNAPMLLDAFKLTMLSQETRSGA